MHDSSQGAGIEAKAGAAAADAPAARVGHAPFRPKGRVAPSSSALAHLVVLDLTRVRAGPACVRQLADWGANVIKIEPPEGDKAELGGPRAGSDFQNLHRGKQSLTLDLKRPAGMALFRRLAAGADVVVENFRPGVKHRLGIDYATLAADNPGLVYASISGFGQSGPYADRPGFDQIAQGLGGLMSITGEPGRGPMRVGIPVADLTAGLFAAQAILVALLERQVSGRGQWVQTSLLQAQMFMLDFQAARYTADGEVPGQAGNNHPTMIPTGVFATADGHMNVSVAGEHIWARFCETLGRPDWVTRPGWESNAGRAADRDGLNAAIEAVTRMRPTADWVAALTAAGVPAGQINDIGQAFRDPQAVHNEAAQPVEVPGQGRRAFPAQPIHMSRTPSRLAAPPPTCGQDTEALLTEMGLDGETIAALRHEGAI
ncbi:MAG: CoA transferase [Pseudomonadota bacterium]